jgi:hypothetical protein
MMKPLGYQIVLYAGENNDADCTEHVTVVTPAEQQEWYGDLQPNLLPFKVTWDAKDTPWVTLNRCAEREIERRLDPEDLILVTGGRANLPLAEAFPEHAVVEWAAGYESVFAKFICFESYAWMHHIYGKHLRHSHGRWYDCVICPVHRLRTPRGSAEGRDGRLREAASEGREAKSEASVWAAPVRGRWPLTNPPSDSHRRLTALAGSLYGSRRLDQRPVQRREDHGCRVARA